MEQKEFNYLYDGLNEIPLRESKREMWFLLLEIAVNNNDKKILDLIKDKIKRGKELKELIKKDVENVKKIEVEIFEVEKENERKS